MSLQFIFWHLHNLMGIPKPDKGSSVSVLYTLNCIPGKFALTKPKWRHFLCAHRTGHHFFGNEAIRFCFPWPPSRLRFRRSSWQRHTLSSASALLCLKSTTSTVGQDAVKFHTLAPELAFYEGLFDKVRDKLRYLVIVFPQPLMT